MAIALTLGGVGQRLRGYAPGSDVGLALGMLALLAVLVVPLPTMLLDDPAATVAERRDHTADPIARQ